MDPLRTSAKESFVEIDLARINPEGLSMDNTQKPDEVASVLEEMHAAGKGVVGMKILGEGKIKTPERKDASLRDVLGLGTVDAFIIGFELTEQIDDILKRTTDAPGVAQGLIALRRVGSAPVPDEPGRPDAKPSPPPRVTPIPPAPSGTDPTASDGTDRVGPRSRGRHG